MRTRTATGSYSPAGTVSGNGPAAEDSDAAGRRPRRRRLVIAAILVTAGVIAALVRLGLDDDGPEATRAATATGTAEVVRRDLVVTDDYEGELGFGDTSPVAAGRNGVVTGASALGTTVASGQALFHIDLEPTVLLAGSVPAFRQLDVDATDGADVRQLEQALVDLGFGDGLTVDEHFASATARAVEAWEETIGRAHPDGTVELGDVAFLPGPVRVSEVSAEVGKQVQPEADVLQVTSTTKVVTLTVRPDVANRLEAGTAVQLELADGTETTGKVTDIGTASSTTGTEGEGPNAAAPTVPVTVPLDDPAVAQGLDSGSVDARIERSRVDDAVAVPVTALLALAEGGYAVEVVDATAEGGSRLVAVEVGTYADEYVQVDGPGIEPGVDVVVPA